MPASPAQSRPSRVVRVVSATRANVVRLIPGRTLLPLMPDTAVRPGAA
jgi:hypothetical protein